MIVISLFPLSSLIHIFPPSTFPIIIIIVITTIISFSSPDLLGDILGKMRQVYIKCKLLM